LSLHLFIGAGKIVTDMTKDLIYSKKGVYLQQCNQKNMICNDERDAAAFISSCQYMNTKNCVCYECLSNLNFNDCLQCYAPATEESFCVNDRCKIPKS